MYRELMHICTGAVCSIFKTNTSKIEEYVTRHAVTLHDPLEASNINTSPDILQHSIVS